MNLKISQMFAERLKCQDTCINIIKIIAFSMDID